MPRTTRFSLVILVSCLLGLPLACADGPTSGAGGEPAPASDTDPSLPSSPATPPAGEAPPDARGDGEALVPEVDGVSPDHATVGSVGPSVIVSGNNFVARSIVQLDGAPLATTFVSATELRATIPTSKLASVGALRLSVGTSPPGGGASKEVFFEVENPVAALTSLSPLSVVAGAGTTTLHLTGSGFVDGAKVVFGATDLATTFGSPTSLEAVIPASLLASSGSAPVKVVNPPPGGGDSTTIAFTVSNPDAAIQSVTPPTCAIGAAAIPLVVKGSGYVAASTVLFNGTSLSTTFVSAGELHASVPASSLDVAGDFPVVVSNPPPGGGLTAPYAFHVLYPAPQASSLSPSSAVAGAAPTQVTVTGSGFFPASQITFDGAPAATTYVDATHVRATLSSAQLASGGVVLVRVANPSPGGGASAATAFTVNNPAPAISSLSPSSVTAGSGDRAITVLGSGFLASSVVRANGQSLATTFVTSSQLSAIVPSSQLVNPGSVAITVVNAAPGGGVSAARSLVVGCDTSGVDVSLNAVGATALLATSFASAPSMSRFDDESSSCQTTTLLVETQPARYWVVQNTSGATLTLSAWAVCTADGQQDDAYLTFYRRPTPPATDLDRLACTGAIAEGVAGAAGLGSPEAGASQWCPGLTKANGGGLTLAACEKAVVHVQPYSMSSATYTAPPQVRVKAE
jgi:hypothetical protein